MRKIELKNIQDGMVLAEPLYGASGSVLMPKGITLKVGLVSRLKAWGVNSVSVEGEEENSERRAADTSDVEKIPLEVLFTGKITTKAMQIIFNALAKYRNAKNA